jgi:hypothetical protein
MALAARGRNNNSAFRCDPESAPLDELRTYCDENKIEEIPAFLIV